MLAGAGDWLLEETTRAGGPGTPLELVPLMLEQEMTKVSAHPIVDILLAALQPGAEGKFRLGERGVEQIDHALNALGDRRELARAVLSIAMFAAFLDRDCASPEVAERLCAIAIARRSSIEELVDAFERMSSGRIGRGH